MTALDPQIRRPSIADDYQDMLAPLDDEYRNILVGRLAQGFYEGWRPTRRELAALIADDTGRSGGADPQTANPAAPSGHASAAPPPRLPTAPTTRSGASVSSASQGRETQRRRARHSARTGTSPQALATFHVDCGLLAPGYRFVARSLSTGGMVQRGTTPCRLMSLTYDLHPVVSPGRQQPTGPVTFTAPIICFPDELVPWADGDGQDRHHTVVAGGRVVGRRGPWPLAVTAQRVQFTINRQSPPGFPPSPTPAGRLIVDIRSGRAAWRPT